MSTPRAGIKHFTASVLVENMGAFLLLYHRKLDMWLYPGGHVEPNEEPQDACMRELAEEAGIATPLLNCAIAPHMPVQCANSTSAELAMPLSILCEQIPDKDGGHHWHIDMIYLAQADDAQRQQIVADTPFQWATPEQASALSCPLELPVLMRKALAVLAG